MPSSRRTKETSGKYLTGLVVVNASIYVPGPFAAARLQSLGAAVIKVEPPEGDPLKAAAPKLYRSWLPKRAARRLDWKTPRGREALLKLLERADLFLTSTRPQALERAGLGWKLLHARCPRLCQVAVVGKGGARAAEPGHDLTYLAQSGLLNPPELPRTLLADFAGALEAVSLSLALIHAREVSGKGSYAEVELSRSAEPFSQPLFHGLTSREGLLGGALPTYNFYRTADGKWVALAALEPRFQKILSEALALGNADALTWEALQARFLSRKAGEWERWARRYDIPLSVVQETKRSRR